MPYAIKKPIRIEFRQLTGDSINDSDVYNWVETMGAGSFEYYTDSPPENGVSIDPATGKFVINTLEGLMMASVGDYIIRGIKGEFYPCKPDIFEATYTMVG